MKSQSKRIASSAGEWDVVVGRKEASCGGSLRPLRKQIISILFRTSPKIWEVFSMSRIKKSSACSEHAAQSAKQQTATVSAVSENESPINETTAVAQSSSTDTEAITTETPTEAVVITETEPAPIVKTEISEASDKKEKTKKKIYISTIKIAYIAVLVAINVALSAISPRLGTMKITVSYTMCFLAGYFFGPLIGIAVGGLGDLLGTLISGNTPNPIILAAACLLGAIPGLVKFIRIKKLGKFEWIFHLTASFIACFIICTLFINTYALYLLGLAKGATFWAYMGTRVISQSPIFAANYGLSLVLVPIFEKIYKATVLKRMPAASLK